MKDEHLTSDRLSSPLRIGTVELANRVALAPMSGVTDLPFRRLAQRFGAGLVVTEMVASRELAHDARESWERLKGAEEIRPHMVQLAGRDPRWMGEAARIAADNGADIIDINMGCPAKKVTGGYSGSALMREPDLALSLIEAVVAAVAVPVTVKMRLGWDENSINAPEIARRAEESGVALVTVHGRTRMQFYEGRADWKAIRAVRETISLPLIANGDVLTPEDAEALLDASGADAVMVGRAAQGQPWLPAVLAGHPMPDRATRIATALSHYDAMLDFYGEKVGVRHARKHLGWYLDRLAPAIAQATRSAIMQANEAATARVLFAEALAEGSDIDVTPTGHDRRAA